MDKIILISSIVVVAIIGISLGAIQMGEMSDNFKTIFATLSGDLSPPTVGTNSAGSTQSISAASIGFNIGPILVNPDNKTNTKDEYFINAVSECVFHSETSITHDTCVICTLQDENDVTLAKGKVDLPDGYVASQSINIPINELENPDSNSVTNVEGIMLQVCEEEGFGCTPGYWKNHLFKWSVTGFSPSDNFKVTFGLSPSAVVILKVDGVDVSNPTLGQAIKAEGSGINALSRHAVAALLNSASSINYPLSTTQVVLNFFNAFTSGDYEPTKDIFDQYNNLGCPFGNAGTGSENSNNSGVKSENETKGNSNKKTEDIEYNFKEPSLKTIAKISPNLEEDPSKIKVGKESKK